MIGTPFIYVVSSAGTAVISTSGEQDGEALQNY